jgi:hypothetical protein
MANTRRTRTSRTSARAESGTAGTGADDASVGDGPWTIDRIHALGATTDLRTAATIFGLSRNTAYDLARRGEFPVPVLRVGARYRVSVPAILAILGGCAACTDRQPRSADPHLGAAT